MRWFLEFETTACPFAASAVSTSPATEESRPENRSLDWNGLSQLETTHAAAGSGISPAKRQVQASAYGLPAERSEAASSTTSNHGWAARSWMKRWPTAPVAPRTPTGIRVIGSSLVVAGRAGKDP